ncbi:MAG TPA: hypothetical protein VJV75_06640 [Candidatus Polarisedimenticolia bacterium]|nr:hypothetical protein [Candidatus Polarisedimenticolia bacterium]
MSPESKSAAAVEETAPDIEAEYSLESGANCSSCNSPIQSLQVIRLLRTKVNFTSSLPRRGFVAICPVCRSIITATLGGLLG